MKIPQLVIPAVAIGLMALNVRAEAPRTETTVTSTTAAPKAADEVGIASHDGITMSGADVIVTRNGVSEKLTKVLELSNGTRVQPDGVVITSDGGKLGIRPLQVLTFDGRFLTMPIHESEKTNTTTRTETKTAVSEPATGSTAIVVEKSATDKPATKEAGEEAARKEADRRARAAGDSQK